MVVSSCFGECVAIA